MLQAINPKNGEVIREVEELDEGEIEACLQRADEEAERWRRVSFEERAALMRRAAQVIEERREAYAALMVDEMGKPIKQARAEADKCAWVCRHYAEWAVHELAPQAIETDSDRSYVRHDPLGVVLAVMPWNFPFWQVFRFAAPGLMAGNVGLLKHASNVPGCGQAIEEIFQEAGFPRGCFQYLAIGSDPVEDIICDERVRAVTLTGSTPAGRAVASAAGQALKPTVLELGGSDPFIVLDDADLKLTCDGAVKGRTQNNGQSCIAAKRFLVMEGVYEEFLERLCEGVSALKVGDPREESTDLGPLAREDLRDDLHDQVKRTLEAGAELILGGEPMVGDGSFYEATILAGVEPGMAAFDEETFGPVAAVTRVESLEQAISLANRSSFGLGASVWTADTERARRDIVGRLEAGHVGVNEIVRSDPRMPFGGVKDSGYGRELGRPGIHSFVNQKAVRITR